MVPGQFASYLGSSKQVVPLWCGHRENPGWPGAVATRSLAAGAGRNPDAHAGSGSEKVCRDQERASQFGDAYHDGFSIDVQPLAPPVELPLKVRVVLTSNPKRIEDYPTLDSHLEGVVNEQGEFSVVSFALESIASRTWEAAPGTNTPNKNTSPSGSTSEQEKLIRDFYASYVRWDSYDRREMSKYLSQPLVNGMLKAARRDLDVINPIVPGNGGPNEKEILRTLAVQPFVTERGAGCLVTFNHFGEKYSASYLLQKEGDGWRIADIIARGRSYLKSLPK